MKSDEIVAKSQHVHLIFGSTAAPIAEQLRNQGLDLTDIVTEAIQKLVDALNLLVGIGILRHTESVEARHRIVALVEKELWG